MVEGLIIDIKQDTPIPLNFALTVRRGTTTALVGPSGAGKTTVLRAIAGLHRPANGHISCGGEVWFDSATGRYLPAKDRKVGFVFQSYALFPHLTATGNIAEAMLDRTPQTRQIEARDLMVKLGLEGLEDRMPSQLSGGQQQRVALARALARQPDILLLDEPFSAVDHPTRKLLHRSLEQVRATSDIPIVIVTHDIGEAARIADDLCFMQAGRNIETGPVQNLVGLSSSQLCRWMDDF